MEANVVFVEDKEKDVNNRGEETLSKIPSHVSQDTICFLLISPQ